ncbi:MAG TPA: hypothetical protein VK421_00715 [Pyrinomonadaceae bacterium]|nr:hypothetical protein [Pyrinomonadaceae bacterium]
MIEFLTALLVVLTGVYAWITFKILNANKQTIAVMREQMDVLIRPYVIVNVSFGLGGPVLMLRIANTGRTPANKLRLSLDRNFYQFGEKREDRNLANFVAFREEMASLTPGAELEFPLAQGFVVLAQEADPEITPTVFKVSTEYFYGDKQIKEETIIDLRQYAQSVIKSEPLVKELKNIAEKIDRLKSRS